MITPPRTAERLLESLGAAPDFRDAILGDLAEEFALRAAHDGNGAARHWYYREAIRATPHLLWNGARSLRGRDVRHLAGVVLTSYVLLLVLALMIGGMVRGVMVALGVAPGSGPLLQGGPLFRVAAMMLGVITAMTGGYIAAWLNERAPLVTALVLGAVWSFAAVLITAMAGAPSSSEAFGAVPAWYRFIVPVVIVVGTTLGGMLRVSASRTPRRADEPHLPVG